jgi:anti-anti-sigma factor
MQIEIETFQTDDEITYVSLRGRLDTEGVDEIELKFAGAVISSRQNAIVDFSGVTFMGSLGIRMLIGAGQALANHQAKIVVFAPQPNVLEAMESASLEEIIPVANSADEARELLQRSWISS